MANRICLTCGKEYEFCGSCPSSSNLPVWKNLFDSEDCKVIFETVSDYAQGVFSKDKAKDKLKNCNLPLETNKNIKKYLDEILEEPKIEISVDENVQPQKIKYEKKKFVVTED